MHVARRMHACMQGGAVFGPLPLPRSRQRRARLGITGYKGCKLLSEVLFVNLSFIWRARFVCRRRPDRSKLAAGEMGGAGSEKVRRCAPRQRCAPLHDRHR